MVDREFINELASSAPTPGGGGASAYVGALATALGSMVGNLTVGKAKYAAVEAEVYMCMERLVVSRERLIELVEEDARAFGPLASAYGLPSATPEDKERKQRAIQEALVEACEVPLQIMEECAKVLHEAEFLAYNGSRLVLSDAGAAAVFANAALQGASFNVFINTKSMVDESRAQRYKKSAETMLAEAGVLADELFSYVVSEIS